MPARNRKDAAKQGKIRGFQVGDIIGVKKAGRGNTGPEWLQGTILSVAPGGFYDYEAGRGRFYELSQKDGEHDLRTPSNRRDAESNRARKNTFREFQRARCRPIVSHD